MKNVADDAAVEVISITIGDVIPPKNACDVQVESAALTELEIVKGAKVNAQGMLQRLGEGGREGRREKAIRS